MAKKSYVVDNLVDSLKRRAAIPISQQTFTEDDIVDYLQDEMESTIVPMLMDYREEFFVDYVDMPMPQAGAAIFDIPTQAIGQRLRDIVLVETVDATGEENLTNMVQLSLEKISSNSRRGTTLSGVNGFYIISNQVHLYPSHGWSSRDTLRLYYFNRPSDLTLKKNAGKITAINTINNTITVDNVPVTWVDGYPISTMKGSQPFTTIDANDNIVTIAGYTITLNDVSELEINDWVCEVGEAVIPQIPMEGMNLLLQAAKIVLLESIDDQQNLKIAEAKFKQLEKNFIKAVTNRVDGQPKKITSNNSIFSGRSNQWI